MFRHNTKSLFAVFLTVIAIASCQGGSTVTATPGPKEQTLPVSAWNSPWGDHSNRNLSSWPGPVNDLNVRYHETGGEISLPAVADRAGRLFVPAGSVLIAYSETGTELWRYRHDSEITFCQPTIDDRVVTVTRAGTVTVRSLNVNRLTSFDSGMTDVTQCTCDGDLYMLSPRSEDGLADLVAFDLNTGEELWRRPDLYFPSWSYRVQAGDTTGMLPGLFVFSRPFMELAFNGALITEIEADDEYYFDFKVDDEGYVYQLARAREEYRDTCQDFVSIRAGRDTILRQDTEQRIGAATRIPQQNLPDSWTYLISPTEKGIYYPAGGMLELVTEDGTVSDILYPNFFITQAPNGDLYTHHAPDGSPVTQVLSNHGELLRELPYFIDESEVELVFDDHGGHIVTGYLNIGEEYLNGVTVLSSTGMIKTRVHHQQIDFQPRMVGVDGYLVSGYRLFTLGISYFNTPINELSESHYEDLLGYKYRSYARVDDRLEAYDTNNNVVLTFGNFGSNGFAADLTGNVLVYDTDDNLYRLAADGSVKWQLDGASNEIGHPIIAADDRFLLANANDVRAFNDLGQQVWSFTPQSPYCAVPAVSNDGTVIIPTYTFRNDKISMDTGGSASNRIHAFDLNGNQLWSVATTDDVSQQPIIDSSGNIYLLTSMVIHSAEVICLNAGGTELWRVDVSDHATEGDQDIDDWFPLPDKGLCLVLDNRIVYIKDYDFVTVPLPGG